ncbi:hypothetical protein ACEQ8H_007463 [Pleosporales sp. CAS-2024a]
MAPHAGLNGVLPAAVLHKNRGPKQPQPRLKLVCRRLPPGLTRAEFEAALGPAWTPGAGKVDWLSWRAGKISKDAAKPSRAARVYLHLTRQDHVALLADRFRDATFHDAAKSWQDSALVGPPALEFAPFPKMPAARRRNDNRQGTIDQDHEFKDFLHALTHPIAKTPAPDDTPKHEKVRTTPLIEALREKKASKDKPSAKTRHARGDAKDDPADKKLAAKHAKENVAAAEKSRRASKADRAQAANDAAKSLTKDAAAAPDKSTSAPVPERKRGNVAGVKTLLQRDLGIGAAPNRRRGTKREVASAANEVPQPKDTPAPAQKAKEVPAATAPASEKNAPAAKKERPTRAERRAFKASLADKTNDKTTTGTEGKPHTPTKAAAAQAPQILKKSQPVQSPAPAKSPAVARAPPTEPAATRTPASASASASPAQPNTVPPNPKPTAAVAPAPKAPPPAPVPAVTSKQAFLKHANPSQGITEPLIQESLQAYGAIDKVEIDKRKGFAYVDFAEAEGLKKAMAASPIKIAQGAVQVLERKEKVTRSVVVNPRFNGPPPTGPARGGRGGAFGPGPRGGRSGRPGARGGAHVAGSPAAGPIDSNKPPAPVSTPASAPTPVAATDATT